MKCDNCNRPATVHLTEICDGKKIEKHLCEQCAAQQEGIPTETGQPPLNQLLTNFVLAHSGLQKEMGVACDRCGTTWAEFRQTGLFGCEHDYDVFDKDVTPLLERAHEGATHHVGKTPGRAGGASPQSQRKFVDIARLQKELNRAVEVEDYELAARLRDAIREAEKSE